jgi:WD40 repeat protein
MGERKVTCPPESLSRRLCTQRWKKTLSSLFRASAMPIATRTFRVFVSSTFEDLKAERDALQRDVFPKLRKLCEQHGARFQAIDLRWGVRDEAALDQQTMEICLREIRRCQATGVRPNFIVLLGDRYGWQPLPARIPAAEFDALLPHIPAGDARALATQWYWLDENAVPAEYCLQPRMGEFVTLAAWNPVEKTLHQALAKAARVAGLPEKELVKYEASATHQEILAGLGEKEEDRQHVFGFVRRRAGDTDARLEEVKSQLRVREFEPGNMTALCDLVLAQLRPVIEEEVKRFENRPALDLEVEAHDRFAEERCRIFTGRQAVLDTIADYIRGPERRPLVLHGESGSGKSAVIAKASQQYQRPGRMIRRFIGASPESASGHALLTSLCRQMAPGDTPVDYAQLENTFKERLSAAAGEQPLVLFIDALDQLAAGDPARDVTWLPPELPPHVKVIVSTTSDGERLPTGLLVHLERMAQSEGERALDELLWEAQRTLQPWQRATVLAHFERCGLPLYLKLAAEESRLWKSYAPQDACALGEGVTGIIDTLFDRLSSNTNHGPTLVERSLGYLAAARYGLTEDEALDLLTADDTVWNDFDQRKHHEVSERRLPVVVWSRLSLDLEPYLTERSAPGGTVIAFYHRQLAERVAGRFLAGAELQARHSNLARYFSAKPAWLDEGRKAPNARRSVELVFQQRGAWDWTGAEETLFDCQFLLSKCAAGLPLDLEADYRTLSAEAPEEALPHRQALGLIQGALTLSMHVLARDWRQYASQMVGRLLGMPNMPEVARFVNELTASASRPWIRPLHPCLDGPGGVLLRVLEGLADPQWKGSLAPDLKPAVAVSADGKRAVTAFRDETIKVWDLERGRETYTLEGHSAKVLSVAVTADGRRAVSASYDKTLKMWDLETGRELRTLEGHSDYVDCVAVTADGKRAVSASGDWTLKVWDLETGRELRTLEGHSGYVDCVAVTADGKRAISTSYDRTLKVWELETGRTLRTLEVDRSIDSVAVTADGKRAVSASCVSSRESCVSSMKVWDLETGRTLRTLEVDDAAVYSVAVTADGRRAVSASSEGKLRVWDLESGIVLHTLEGHSHWVTGVSVTADGRRAVSVSTDNTLRFWDLEGGTRAVPIGHSECVLGVALTAEGKLAVSASGDKTLKVWDVRLGSELYTLEGHSHGVRCVAVTADGKRAISASFGKTLRVWNLENGRELRSLKNRSYGVEGVAVTADGKRAVSVSWGDEPTVWDIETGRVLRLLESPIGTDPELSLSLTCVAVTADGKQAVSASSIGVPTVWDIETGQILQEPEDSSDEKVWAKSVAISGDGRRVVFAANHDALMVWDLAVGRALWVLQGHSGPVKAVAVAADGKWAVSASFDKTLKVWNLETGEVVGTFFCETYPLCCGCTAPNLIAAGDEGGRVYFLALEE